MKRIKSYRRIRAIRMLRLIVDGAAFLLIICCMVLLVSVYSRLPERFPLNFDEYGRISEWGTPIHFIVVFGAGMFLYGGLSVIARFKNIFGVSLFADEHKGRTKYEATMLLFAFLKFYSLAMFLIVMYNMYARVQRWSGMVALDWLIFAVMGAILLTVGLYVFAIARLNARKKPRDKKSAQP